MKKEKNKETKRFISEDAIREIKNSISLINGYSLKDILDSWLVEKVDEEIFIEQLKEWNRTFSQNFEINPDTNEMPVYKEFIRIKNVYILIKSIFSIQPYDRYNYTEAEQQYGILINKTENVLVQNANEFIIFESEDERDLHLSILKDKLALFEIRFY